MRRARLAVTSGDPAGVGPEIVSALLEEGLGDDLALSVIGPEAWVESLSSASRFEGVGVPMDGPLEWGKPSEAGARAAIEAMTVAAEGCREGRFDAVATGPIAKEWAVRVGYPFPGQTEFFADRWGGIPTMAFVGAMLRVALATWHVPLREVPNALDRASLKRAVERAIELAEATGSPVPKVGVCGLNPHAGENGVLGREETDWMNESLSELRELHPGVSNCLPGDTVFRRAMLGDFDVVVAAYHDQGLAPLKTVDFDTAVNVTLGLPFVRTSPDHGTAFDIAGKGVASTESFRRAIRLAADLFRRRSQGANA